MIAVVKHTTKKKCAKNVGYVLTAASVKKKMNEIILLTSKTCPNCPAMKQLLQEHGVKFREIDTESKKFEDLQLDLLRNGIYVMFVPTIIEKNGTAYKEIHAEDII